MLGYIIKYRDISLIIDICFGRTKQNLRVHQSIQTLVHIHLSKGKWKLLLSE